ncbi:MAG: CDGSH iron-sulfur domain-containing protein [Candidatus Krumholzibacteriia bacterium]
MSEVKITTLPNGPYVVEGPIQLVDGRETAVETSDRPKLALCRCGASANKPFCDGSHGRVGFQDPAPESGGD